MTPKTTKILYWILNGLFAVAMLFTCIDSIAVGEQSVQIIHGVMGYPEYIIPLTGWMKVIGIVVILLPVKTRFKEWAYAGLCIDIFLAIYSIGKSVGLTAESWPMLIYVLLAVGAYYFHVKKEKLDGQAV